ncbi:MAG: hypothetical protein AAF741_11830 [Bacteroidota bacterium]
MKTKHFLIALWLCPVLVFAQDHELDVVRQHDLSQLFGSFTYDIREDNNQWVAQYRPAPIGFIGDEYRRMHVRWLSVTQSEDDPLVYEVSGKTMVKNNICDFTGYLRITAAARDTSIEFPDERTGTIFGHFELVEDRSQPGTGEFRGQFKSHYWLPFGPDRKQIPTNATNYPDATIIYNTLEFFQAGYGNNQFKGTWTSYRTGKSKAVAWADHRFDFPTDLDVGASEFAPNEKYFDMGWKSYFAAWIHADPDRLRGEAQRAEMAPWWEDQ